MADKKISELTALSSASGGDVLPIVDVSANVTAKITKDNLLSGHTHAFTDITGTVPTTQGGTGLASLGTAGQVLKVNSGATALEYADDAGGSASGDITSVVAGTGLTGGASSGDATLNVVGGDGITAGANEIEVTVDGSTLELSASDGSGSVRIKDDGVTYAKIQNVSSTDRLLGRDSSGAGIIEEITPANVRTMLNVADGATANTGDITSVVAGTGLTGGATSGAATVNVDVGIADDKIVQIDSASVADDDFAKFTANGLEGRSASEVLSDISAAASSHTHALNDLSDVNTTGAANGKIIKHNGTSWVIGDDADTAALTTEQVQDIVGAMFTGNTETRVAATYEDGDGTIDLVVDDMTANDNTWRTVTAGGNTLSASETLAFTAGTGISISESAGAVTITNSVSDAAKLNVTQTWTKAQIPALQTAAFSALSSGVLDFDSYQNFVITLGAGSNAFTNPSTDASNAGQTGVIVLIQHSSASAATWASDYKLVGGSAPDLSSGSAKVDILPYMIQADNTILIGAPQLDFSSA